MNQNHSLPLGKIIIKYANYRPGCSCFLKARYPQIRAVFIRYCANKKLYSEKNLCPYYDIMLYLKASKEVETRNAIVPLNFRVNDLFPYPEGVTLIHGKILNKAWSLRLSMPT